jgi:hypothetical protein
MGCSESTVETDSSPMANADWFFVIDADEATVSEVTLSLKNVDTQIPGYTDRPYRQRSMLSWTEIGDLWEDSGALKAVIRGTYTGAVDDAATCAIEVELTAAPKKEHGQ